MTRTISGAVDEAYAACALITKDRARNFYHGIRLLPAPKRAVLCAVYALARHIDDIGDGDLPAAEKVSELARVRRWLRDIDASRDPVLLAVADAARRYPIPLEAFGELVDGVRMDVTGRDYRTFDDLIDYCRCVAGSVGRLCLGVFGSRPDPRAAQHADALGIALQQVNILRDLREDFANGRVYLPAQDLDRYGVRLIADTDGNLVDPDGGLAELIRASAARASRWYDEGLRLVPLLDRRSAACCIAMSGMYRGLLARIAARPTVVYRRRLSLPAWRKAEVTVAAMARAMLGLAA